MVLSNQVDRGNCSYDKSTYGLVVHFFKDTNSYFTIENLRYYLSDFYQSFRERCNFFVNVMMIDLLQDFLDPHLSN